MASEKLPKTSSDSSNERVGVLPTQDAGFFSYVSVSWLTSLMWKAYKNGIQPEDIWSLPAEESSKVNGDRLQKLWDEETTLAKETQREPRLWKSVWRFCRTRILICQMMAIALDIFNFSEPMFFLRWILDYINSPEVDYVYGAILLVTKIIASLFIPILLNNTAYIMGIHTSSRLTGALQALIYKKILTVKTGGENLSAKVTNLSSNDMERIFSASLYFIFVVEVPMLFSLSLAYSLYLIGPWALMGFGVYFFYYPLTALVAKCQSIVRQRTIKETDRRVALMSEILNSIQLIKMYAWEEPFAKKIAGFRHREMKMHRLAALLTSFSTTLSPSIGILATIATILVYTHLGNPITSTEAFTLLNVFSMMCFTVSLLTYAVKHLAEASVSLQRLQSLLLLPEHEQTPTNKDSSTYAIHIQDASFAWEITDIDCTEQGKNDRHLKDCKTTSGERGLTDKSLDSSAQTDLKDNDTVTPHKNREDVKTTETLFNIQLSIPHGKLIGVCGSIGSGKSSLISAICGDMLKEHGSTFINGQLALVTQQAWIYNGTLRDNILLGTDYQDKRYNQALQYCCLQSDLDLLPAKDMTEIGERGINLSGGQKQRVNLARAVYSDRDIYLLDDPLSAVDAKVANSIFNNCIKGYLKKKTVLLVTHALHLLEQCDEIIVMKEGMIIEKGTNCQLLSQCGEYYSMVGGDTSEKSKQHQNLQDISNLEKHEDSNDGSQLDGNLTKEETRGSGSVANRVYQTFIKVCGGWFQSSSLVFAVVIFVLIRLFNDIWLQVWLDEGDGLITERQLNVTHYNLTLSEDELRGSVIHNPLLWMYQTIYGASFLALIVVGIAKGVGLAFSVLSGASRLHNAMFTSILRSPMSFFDTTPSGRILNRFSRDLDELDVRIPFFLELVLQGVLTVIGQAILVCTIYFWLIIPVTIVLGLFIILDKVLNVGVRELKRIDNTRKSPVLQHFGSSLSGVSVIRMFDRQELFTKRMYKYLDEHTVAYLLFHLSSRWYVFRSNILSVIINSSVTAICLFTKGLVSTATAGLALSTMSSMCNFFPYLMSLKAEFQSRFTAVERIVEYSYDLSSEAPHEDPGEPVPRGWPVYGCVEIKKVSMRYRPVLPLVLHDIEATFYPCQKIGIVGRTGSGKTSLITSLLRLVEVESGSIVIDGVDVASLGLHTLRSAISVIPQDPILFQGSIRYNLDPFEEHSDAAVWEALEQSNLKKVVQQQVRGLQSSVSTAGENFSVGERQLICLTRALLRKSKILLLDEATASVDLETDQMIQTTIRKAFVQSTVITIAHRLNTVTTYDKILVLRDGRVVEFASPQDLMRREGSLFREIMLAMGVSTVEQMEALT